MEKLRTYVKRAVDAAFRVPFIASSIHFSVYSIIKMAAAPLRSKVSALSIGAAGIGHFGIIQNYQMFAFSFGCLGLGTGLTTEISRCVKEDDQAGVERALGVSFTGLVISSAISVVFLLCTLRWFAVNVFLDASFLKLMIPPVLTLPLYALGTCYLEPLLYGYAKDPSAAKVYKWATIGDLIVFLPLVFFLDIRGAACSLFFAGLFHFSGLLYQVKKECPQVRIFRFDWRADLFFTFLKTGFTMLLSGASTYGVSLAIRAIIMRTIGESANGHYQAVLALSSFYAPFVSSAIWVRLYPQAGAHGLSRSVLLEFTETMVYTAFFSCLAQSFILIGPELVLRLLYSREFIPAAEILPFRFVGDYCFLLSQPVLGVLLGLQCRRQFLAAILGSQALFAGLAYELSRFGLQGLAVAYFGSNLVLALGCLGWYLRKISTDKTFLHMRRKIFILLGMPFLLVGLQAFLLEEKTHWAPRAILFACTCAILAFVISRKGIREILDLRKTFNGEAENGA